MENNWWYYVIYVLYIVILFNGHNFINLWSREECVLPRLQYIEKNKERCGGVYNACRECVQKYGKWMWLIVLFSISTIFFHMFILEGRNNIWTICFYMNIAVLLKTVVDIIATIVFLKRSKKMGI